ncbi:uncharacterized protein [Paramormyrops kingsleyae]|uniref:uncharacterized protein n=1 Tax=Paramormyrops kingsleyae TaxID=1676925 RepID=UPI003B96F1C8
MVMNLRSRRSLSAAGGSSAECELPGLADLLEKACTRLLELYKEKESFTSDITLTKDRIITLPPTSPHLSADEQLSIMHPALHHCFMLLETVMCREEKEELVEQEEDEYRIMQNKVEKDYKDMQNTVQGNLRNLLQCIKPTELPDGSGNGNTFAMKLWIYRILHELMHWIECTNKIFQKQQSEQERQSRVTRRRGGLEKRRREGEGEREREWRSKVRRRVMEGKVANGSLEK